MTINKFYRIRSQRESEIKRKTESETERYVFIKYYWEGIDGTSLVYTGSLRRNCNRDVRSVKYFNEYIRFDIMSVYNECMSVYNQHLYGYLQNYTFQNIFAIHHIHQTV